MAVSVPCFTCTSFLNLQERFYPVLQPCLARKVLQLLDHSSRDLFSLQASQSENILVCQAPNANMAQSSSCLAQNAIQEGHGGKCFCLHPYSQCNKVRSLTQHKTCNVLTANYRLETHRTRQSTFYYLHLIFVRKIALFPSKTNSPHLGMKPFQVSLAINLISSAWYPRRTPSLPAC